MPDLCCKPTTRCKKKITFPPLSLRIYMVTASRSILQATARAPCLTGWGSSLCSSVCLRLYSWFPAVQHPARPTGVDGAPKWTLPGPSVPPQMQQLPHGGQGNPFFPRADGSDSMGVCRDQGALKGLCVCALWEAGAVKRSVSVRDRDRARVWSPP